jgi:carbon storage regulator
MLVLSRKISERIRIGDSIVLTVVKIQGSIVRLGIEAPAEVHIARDELLARDGDMSGEIVSS